jgi:hypothetical protein
MGMGQKFRRPTWRGSMIATLRIPTAKYRALVAHILPTHTRTEQAAFLFATSCVSAEVMKLDVVDKFLAHPEDFQSQEYDYLELKDSTRALLIKKAHDTNTCLIEAHSHPGRHPAAFSPADRSGLRETVPHMKWRLPGRPYVAMVFANGSFDALVWFPDCVKPTRLSALQLDEKELFPTQLSLWGW